MSGKRKYTNEELATEALKYTSRNEFKINSNRKYRAAHGYGIIDNITTHMVVKHPLICSICGVSKALTDFVKNLKCTEGYTQTCRVCKNLEQAKRAKNNPNMKSIRNKAATKAKNITRAKMLEYHGGTLACEDCGYTSDIPAVFDYHHLDPSTKEHEVSSMLDRKWDIVLKELNKCVLLCANCHRIRHYKEKD